MKKNKFSIIIIVVFLAMMILPLMNTRLTGGDHSATEKRYLAPLPDVLIDGDLNQDLLNEFTDWLSDHIGYREEMVRLVSEMKLKIFNQSPSEQVHIGKDGWYYYTMNDNLKIATGDYQLSQENLKKILQTHLAAQKKLQEKGIDYVIIMPCSKASIYPEYIRNEKSAYRETPVDIVADYLEQNSDLKIIRLKQELLDAKEDMQVYFKTDTHWTHQGAYVGYQKIISELKKWGLCDTEPVEADFVNASFLGEFGAMMGSSDVLGEEQTLNTAFSVNTSLSTGAELSDGLKQCLNEAGIQNPCYEYKNTKLSGHKSVLMFGDSMFGGWNATNLLAEHFSEFTYIWSSSMYDSIIDYVNPDVVFYEATERFLINVPDWLSGFVFEPLEEHQAEIQSYYFEGNDLFVSVKNTSSVLWQNKDRIRCGICQNQTDPGIRAELDPAVIVKPGESVVFKFEDIKDSLNDTAKIVMLQEGVAYFPERVQISF